MSMKSKQLDNLVKSNQNYAMEFSLGNGAMVGDINITGKLTFFRPPSEGTNSPPASLKTLSTQITGKAAQFDKLKRKALKELLDLAGIPEGEVQ